ncbi:hypothetical protein D1007_20738 [Hordeum vulgare]|nr:hypothetical protein D1007_20738 [Hordeum vulgare]
MPLATQPTCSQRRKGEGGGGAIVVTGAAAGSHGGGGSGEGRREEADAGCGLWHEGRHGKVREPQATGMAEQYIILESIQDETYAEVNRWFIQQERAATNLLVVELEARADAEKPELRLSPVYAEPDMEIMDISNED